MVTGSMERALRLPAWRESILPDGRIIEDQMWDPDRLPPQRAARLRWLSHTAEYDRRIAWQMAAVVVVVPFVMVGGLALIGAPSSGLILVALGVVAILMGLLGWILHVNRNNPLRMAYLLLPDETTQDAAEERVRRALARAGRTAVSARRFPTSKYSGGREERRIVLDIAIAVFILPEVGDAPRYPPHLYLTTRDRMVAEPWARLKGLVLDELSGLDGGPSS